MFDESHAEGAVCLLLTASLTGCADMNKRQRNTVIGAAVGGVAGSVDRRQHGGHRGWRVVGGVIGSQGDSGRKNNPGWPLGQPFMQRVTAHGRTLLIW